MRKIGLVAIAIILMSVTSPIFAEETLTLEELVRRGNEKREAEDKERRVAEEKERRLKPSQPIVVVAPQSSSISSTSVVVVIPGQVEEITSKLWKMDWPTTIKNGEIINHKKIEHFSGWTFNRIRIQELLERIVKKADYLVESKGWSSKLLRFTVVMKMSGSSIGISGSPSVYKSDSSSTSNYGQLPAGSVNDNVSQSLSVSIGGSLGWSQSKVDPEMHIIFFQIIEEVK